jgi:hypothetical protein
MASIDKKIFPIGVPEGGLSEMSGTFAALRGDWDNKDGYI